MDAVELARRRAADLYRILVAAGRSPSPFYEFVSAVANSLELDIEESEPGAEVLKGARATLSPVDGLIIHENTGGDFERAFLVAHEIGHAVLGDAVGDEPQYLIDPMRPAEASPSGFDRVVDYGRRQRRETQMDLFARELLLPREIARRLHLDDGLTASEIAQQIGAPFDFVAQQLFDALLLPIQHEEASAQVELSLNPHQLKAAEYPGRFFLLEAGPGTGKTQTLVGRVSYLLSRGVDARRILVLTFSNKAAGEMADRIAGKDKAAAAAMWIGTFHAFGLDLVRRLTSEFGLPKDPELLDRTEAVELLQREFPRIPLYHYRETYDPTRKIADILAAISRAKDEVVDPEAYAALAQAMLGRAQGEEDKIAAEKASEVALVYAHYEKRKRELHRVDFGDLVFLPAKLLEANALVREHLQQRYDHVIVDEYQDVNRSSIRLLTVLAERANVWAVGDGKQSIYRFRGASSYNMERFDGIDFPGAERGRLTENYRSVPEVLAAVTAFSGAMKAGGPESTLHPSRPPIREHPELRLLETDERQTVAIADAIEEARKLGYSYRDQAVLCTGNERLSTLASNLESLGLPVLFLGSLFERPEVKDLLALVSILTDGRAMGLARLAQWLRCELSLPDVAGVIGHLRTTRNTGMNWLVQANDIPDLSPAGQTALLRLAQVLNGFDEHAKPWDVLATVLLDRTRHIAELASSEQIADRARGIAIWQLLNFVRVQPPGQGLPCRRLLDRIRRLVRLSDERDLRQLPAAALGLDAVRLTTVHGAKGLEFPVVHFSGINKGTIPRAAIPPPCPPPDGMVEGAIGSSSEIFRAAHTIEQECLFYVGISRARDRIFLYASLKNTAGASRPLSPFVDQLGPNLRRRQLYPTRGLPLPPDELPITVNFQGSSRFSAEQLGLYEGCGRRFFYTHLLQIGGARTATPFTQMHDAVRTVMNGIIEGNLQCESDSDRELHLTNAFKTHGLAGHGYEREYLALAKAMVTYLQASRADLIPEKARVLVLRVGHEEILITPDDILVEQGGRRHIRKVKTGHYRSSAMKDVAAAAFIGAVQTSEQKAVAEIVYLGDGRIVPFGLSDRELSGRLEKLAKYIGKIRAGSFPASPDPWTCPGCPAFFICGPTPSGELIVES